MNKNNAKDYLPFIQALAEGKTIQVNLPHTGWEDLDGDYNIDFGRKPEYYRIKAETIKWWIMPKYSVFDNKYEYDKFGPCYYVEPQTEIYSRSKPPLMMDFNSRKEAEEWLSNYLREDDLFRKAKDTIDYVIGKLECIGGKFKDHEYACSKDLKDFLEVLSSSVDHGTLKEVTKE